MTFKVWLDSQPKKFLKKLDQHISARIISKINATLPSNPVPQNAKAIEREHGVFRIRIGEYRILYRIDNPAMIIVIVKIDKRSRVYD